MLTGRPVEEATDRREYWQVWRAVGKSRRDAAR